jgi:lysophospholipase L1-like esterase
VYEEAVAQGDRNVYTVDGCSLIGPGDEGGYVDGLHPNDIGFRQMAERLQPLLREVLRIP